MSTSDLHAYREWFLEIMASRLSELRKAINEDDTVPRWDPDYSEESIERLGVWLATEATVRPRTKNEIEGLVEQTPFKFPASENELTNRTFSLAFDAGMYLGETFCHDFPHLQWEQPLRDKKFADFGQMIISGFGRATLNPVRIVVTYFYGIVSGQQSPKRFTEVFDYWRKLAEKQQKG